MRKLIKFPTTYFVIGMATIGFLGLSILQIINLDSSLKTNHQIFKQKVHLASAQASSIFMEDKTYGRLLYEATQPGTNTSAEKQQMDRIFRSLIEQVLRDHGITIPYEYAIYADKQRKPGFDYVMGDIGTTLDFPLVSCEYPDQKGVGWVTLTCSPTGNYHLALFFPDEDQYIFAQTRDALLLTVLFILMLIGCFSYTIIVIRKQKKLSEIKT